MLILWRNRMGIFQARYVNTFFVLHYMSLVRRFYPKRLTYSILWAIPTGAIWGEVSCPGTHRHADCSGVWTCDPLIPTPTLNPLHIFHVSYPTNIFREAWRDLTLYVWVSKMILKHLTMTMYSSQSGSGVKLTASVDSLLTAVMPGLHRLPVVQQQDNKLEVFYIIY